MFDINAFLKNLTSVKIFIIGVLTTSLFFYLSIYLFGKWLIKYEQAQIPIIISLCLGFVWYSLNVLTSSFTQSRLEPKKDGKILVDEDVLLMNVFLAPFLIFICTAIFKIIQRTITVNVDKWIKLFSFIPLLIFSFSLIIISIN